MSNYKLPMEKAIGVNLSLEENEMLEYASFHVLKIPKTNVFRYYLNQIVDDLIKSKSVLLRFNEPSEGETKSLTIKLDTPLWEKLNYLSQSTSLSKGELARIIVMPKVQEDVKQYEIKRKEEL